MLLATRRFDSTLFSEAKITKSWEVVHSASILAVP